MSGDPATWRRPRAYDDPPDTRIEPLDDGYELVQHPSGRAACRETLSPSGRRRHARLTALTELGYEVVSARGTGMVVDPSRPDRLWSIAAAALHEGLGR